MWPLPIFAIFFISMHYMYISLLRKSESLQTWARWQISGVKLLCVHSCLMRSVVFAKRLLSTGIAIIYNQLMASHCCPTPKSIELSPVYFWTVATFHNEYPNNLIRNKHTTSLLAFNFKPHLVHSSLNLVCWLLFSLIRSLWSN